MEKRKILFIGGTTEPGGLHIHTADVARAMARAGHEIAILNLSVDYFSQLLAGSAVRVHSVPTAQGSLTGFNAWRRALAPYAGWDLVLCRGEAGDTSLSDLCAIRSRAARLFTIEHRPCRLNPATPALKWIRQWVAGRIIRRAIAVSEETQSSLIAGGHLPPGKVVCCLNWVNAAAFRTSDKARRRARARLGIGEEITAIGYLGRLAPEKRVDLLIEAFASLDRAGRLRLVLIGDGWKKAELQRLTADRGVADHVVFAGWQSDPAEALAAVDIFVLPSLVEGFALSLLEAMAAGCLCVTHTMDSALAAIRDGETGLLGNFQAVEGIAQTLRRALAMTPVEHDAIRAAGTRSVTTQFDRHLRLPAVLTALEAPDAARIASNAEQIPTPRHFAFSA
ncbi:MAG: glycosyltransferase family 4 protein [Alphaproteobacteria bacterium]